jgi:uroporphyrinogen-III synthase
MASGASLAEALPIEDGDRVLLARTPLADAAVRERLRARGAVVEEVAAYRTRLAPAASRESLREALDAPGGLQAICFLSSSAVNGLLELATDDQLERCLELPALCIGSGTAQACRDAGFREVLEADSKRADAVAALAARRLAPARGAMTA